MNMVSISTKSIKPKGTRSSSPINKTGPSTHQCNEKFTRRVAEAAYFKAESRGFEPGHEMEDWLNAEKEAAQ